MPPCHSWTRPASTPIRHPVARRIPALQSVAGKRKIVAILGRQHKKVKAILLRRFACGETVWRGGASIQNPAWPANNHAVNCVPRTPGFPRSARPRALHRRSSRPLPQCAIVGTQRSPLRPPGVSIPAPAPDSSRFTTSGTPFTTIGVFAISSGYASCAGTPDCSTRPLSIR